MVTLSLILIRKDKVNFANDCSRSSINQLKRCKKIFLKVLGLISVHWITMLHLEIELITTPSINHQPPLMSIKKGNISIVKHIMMKLV